MKTWDIKTLLDLKARGFKQIAAVTKMVRNYTYYNVQMIDDIIANDGRWIGNINKRISNRDIDWSITIRKGDAK